MSPTLLQADRHSRPSAADILDRIDRFNRSQPATRARLVKPTQPADHITGWVADDLRLDGEPFGPIHDALTDGSLDRTIDGASVLGITLTDPIDRETKKRKLISNPVWKRGAKVTIPGYGHEAGTDLSTGRQVNNWQRAVGYVQVKSQKQGDVFTVDFEDSLVNILRKDDSYVVGYRDAITRAQFILALIQGVNRNRGVDIKFWCPQINVRQPIAAGSLQSVSKTTSTQTHSSGFAGAKVTIKGSDATSEQLSVLSTCLTIAGQLGAPVLAQIAMVETLIQENDCTNRPGGGGSSNGAFQLIASTASGMGINALDLHACCTAFLTRGFTGSGGAIPYAKSHPSASPDAVAQAVQGSGAGASFYAQWEAESRHIVQSWTGKSTDSSTSTSVAQFQRYAFARGKPNQPETNWDCFQRLAKEVNWRCYMDQDVLCFVSDDDLLKYMPRKHISESTEGIEYIDWSNDESNKAGPDQLTVTAEVRLWDAVPGQVLAVYDMGIEADGLWIITDVKRPLYDTKATITAERPRKALPEPSPDLVNQTGSGATGATGNLTGSDLVNKAYKAAQAIVAKRYPYVWGGGHARSGKPDGGTSGSGVGYDCSGFTSAVAHEAGMLGSQPLDSTGFESWGEPGRGQMMTVWANGGHVWIEFHLPGKSQEYCGTTSSAPGGGPGFKGWPGDGYAAQFTPRHYPGT